VSANVTNTVALVFNSLGATLGARPELTGQRPTLVRRAGIEAAGGATCAGLLQRTKVGRERTGLTRRRGTRGTRSGARVAPRGGLRHPDVPRGPASAGPLEAALERCVLSA
jgi:hypothetical protein